MLKLQNRFYYFYWFCNFSIGVYKKRLPEDDVNTTKHVAVRTKKTLLLIQRGFGGLNNKFWYVIKQLRHKTMLISITYLLSTGLSIKLTISLDVTPCSLVNGYERFGENYYRYFRNREGSGAPWTWGVNVREGVCLYGGCEITRRNRHAGQRLVCYIKYLLRWPASWLSGQSSWLLTMRSRVRFPTLLCAFFLERGVDTCTSVLTELHQLPYIIFFWLCISVRFVLITNLTHLFNGFISLLYKFRATQCSSSGESIVSIHHLVYVTVCRWHIPDDVLIQFILLMMSTGLLETCREVK